MSCAQTWIAHAGWRRRLVLNAAGATLCAVVLSGTAFAQTTQNPQGGGTFQPTPSAPAPMSSDAPVRRPGLVDVIQNWINESAPSIVPGGNRGQGEGNSEKPQDAPAAEAPPAPAPDTQTTPPQAAPQPTRPAASAPPAPAESRRGSSLQETIKDAAKSASDTLTNLPGASTVSGRELCAVAPNGSADCDAAAAVMCKKNGYKAGKSVDYISAEKCPLKVYLQGRQKNPGECRMETFVTKALCQ